MNDAFLSMLGLAMKAGRLSVGHDAAKLAIRASQAELCILTADASQRLREEMSGLFPKCLNVSYTMDDIKKAIGKRAGVVAVNDEGFAEKLAATDKEGN